MRYNYSEYLSSDYWKDVKRAKRAISESCQLCGDGGKVNVHHKHYKTFNNEDVEKDLIMLCSKCHGLIHKMQTFNTDDLILLNGELEDKIRKLETREKVIFYRLFRNAFSVNEVYGYSTKDISYKDSREEFIKICRCMDIIENEEDWGDYSIIEYKKMLTWEEITKERFTNVDGKEIQNLTKKYSLMLYELCCKYKNQKFYNMRIDVFKRYFSVPKSYEMGEIDRTILKSGVKEIENKTNKRIKYTKVKDGKKISHIKFEFEEVENE